MKRRLAQKHLEQGLALTPGEMALLLRVNPKSIARWAAAGRLVHFKTPGGHLRIPNEEARSVLTGKKVLRNEQRS